MVYIRDKRFLGCDDDTESFDYRSKKIAEARRMKGLNLIFLFVSKEFLSNHWKRKRLD